VLIISSVSCQIFSSDFTQRLVRIEMVLFRPPFQAISSNSMSRGYPASPASPEYPDEAQYHVNRCQALRPGGRPLYMHNMAVHIHVRGLFPGWTIRPELPGYRPQAQCPHSTSLTIQTEKQGLGRSGQSYCVRAPYTGALSPNPEANHGPG
jgi:hypothetical protein